MSWRDNTPQSVQDDLDGLLDSALSLAEEHLGKRGEFFPFGLAIDREGHTQVIDAGTDDAREARQMNFAALKAMRGQIRAAAVVVDVALPQTQSSGVEVHLEHADGPAIGVLEPYTISGGRVEAQPLEGFSAQRMVW